MARSVADGAVFMIGSVAGDRLVVDWQGRQGLSGHRGFRMAWSGGGHCQTPIATPAAGGTYTSRRLICGCTSEGRL